MTQWWDLAQEIVPKYEPKVPKEVKGIANKALSWAAGVGLAMCVLSGLLGWASVAIGNTSDRATLHSRGKTTIVWSLISACGIALTYGLVMTFYNAGG